MPKKIDLTGQRFGRLIVIEECNYKINKGTVWKCKCDCGKYKEVSSKSLRSGTCRSCGCLKRETDKEPKGNVIDLIGQKFGHLTVKERDGSDKRGEAKWLCQCDCGNPNLISVLSSNLRTGHTQSCGCDKRSHGEKVIAGILQKHNIDFTVENKPFKFASGSYASFDFYVNNQYYIEYDGETHYHYNLHGWHNKAQLEAQQERDVIKNQWCIDNNIPLIRIPYWHLKNITIDDLLLDTTQFLITNGKEKII